MTDLYPWQHSLWQRWANLRLRLPNALLIKGPQGIGKLDFAIALSKSLLCINSRTDERACGSCPSCHWFEQGTHPDFRLIQPEAMSANEEGAEPAKKASKLISVEQVRDLSDFFSLSSHQGGYRVVLISPAETMNINAANALLKTLEEPQGNMLFVLVSHKPQQLLPTILSRCLPMVASMPSVDASVAWLSMQGISAPMSLLAQAGYAPLKALGLAREDEELAKRQLLLDQIRAPARLDVYTLAEQLQKTDPALVCQWMQQWCYDLASSKLVGRIRYHHDQGEAIGRIAPGIRLPELLQYQKELAVAMRVSSHPLNSRLQYESMLQSYLHMIQSA